MNEVDHYQQPRDLKTSVLYIGDASVEGTSLLSSLGKIVEKARAIYAGHKAVALLEIFADVQRGARVRFVSHVLCSENNPEEALNSMIDAEYQVRCNVQMLGGSSFRMEFHTEPHYDPNDVQSTAQLALPE